MHVVTVNDYLATRDAEWMGRLHRWLGLTVGRVGPDIDDFRSQARRLRLRRDLRHQHRVRLRLPARQHGAVAASTMVQRGHALRHRRRGRLDPDRRGPHPAHHLGPGVGRGGQALLPVRQHRAHAEPRRRLRGRRGEADRRPDRGGHREGRAGRSASTTSTTRWPPTTSTSSARPCGPRSSTAATRTTWSTSGEVKIVDEFTGRTLDGRRWSDGLHQAVEAKERVRIKEENHTWATVTLQNYFRLYEKLAGMTGTAETEAGRVRQHLRPAGRADPDQPAARAHRRARPHLQDRGGQVQRGRRRHRASASRPGQPVLVGHGVGREVRAALATARQAGDPPTRS